MFGQKALVQISDFSILISSNLEKETSKLGNLTDWKMVRFLLSQSPRGALYVMVCHYILIEVLSRATFWGFNSAHTTVSQQLLQMFRWTQTSTQPIPTAHMDTLLANIGAYTTTHVPRNPSLDRKGSFLTSFHSLPVKVMMLYLETRSW